MQRSTRSHGFTLLELAAVVIVLALIAGMMLPLFTPTRTRTPARQMQNSTHLRGIHSGMVLFAQDNKDFFPGLDSTGAMATRPMPASPGSITGTTNSDFGTASLRGYDPAYRMTILVRGNYFSPEYMISPNESNPLKTVIQTGGNVTSDNFSYAMLRIDQPGEHGEGGRRGEWRTTNNSRAAMLSDRNLASAAGSSARSNFNANASSDPWRGSVIYNDNHAQFQTTSILSTAYTHEILTRGLTGNTPSGLAESVIQADDLFADDKDDKGNAGNDAAMVHQDETTYVDQK